MPKYGLPLLSYSNLASNIQTRNSGVFITNEFYHQRHLATAAFRDINRPNVDTYVASFLVKIDLTGNVSLYSEALVDLSSTDLILTIPEVDDRFYVFPVYDV